MFADPGAHTHSLAVRPAHDAYRSMPGTPLGMDPRGHQSMDMAAAMNHARMGLEGGDYFFPGVNGPNGSKFPPGAMRPGSPFGPFPGPEFDPDSGYSSGASSKGTFGCFPDRHHELLGK